MAVDGGLEPARNGEVDRVGSGGKGRDGGEGWIFLDTWDMSGHRLERLGERDGLPSSGSMLGRRREA